jgi:glycine cleavage system H lipoate-binding protein
MVFALVLLTLLILLAVDLILRREDLQLKNVEKTEKSPIFLSPEKALLPLGNEISRLYHLSHTWIIPSDQGYVFVGYDDFIVNLFTEEVKIEDLPLVGSNITQGTKIWDIKIGNHALTQLAPVSGKIIGINSACKMNLPLPSSQVEKSWILKIKADHLQDERNNLLSHPQAMILNTRLRDDLAIYAQQGHYLNDGGKIDPDYIKRMSDQEWNNLRQAFFPYHKNL